MTIPLKSSIYGLNFHSIATFDFPFAASADSEQFLSSAARSLPTKDTGVMLMNLRSFFAVHPAIPGKRQTRRPSSAKTIL
jgi:hypothetical protein